MSGKPRRSRWVLAAALCVVIASSYALFLLRGNRPPPVAGKEDPPTVNIGYYFNRYNTTLYRAYIQDRFSAEGVRVVLKMVGSDGRLQTVPDSGEGYDPRRNTIDQRLKDYVHKDLEGYLDQLDGLCMPSSTFLSTVAHRSDLVAVATLGREEKSHPHHALLVKKSLGVRSVADLRGKVLEYPQGLPQELLLRELLAQNGLTPKEVKLLWRHVETASPDADGGLYGFQGWMKQKVESGEYVVLRPLDWVDPGVLSALLVFRRDFLVAHPDRVRGVVRAFARQVTLEKSQTDLLMWSVWQGLGYPCPPDPPLVEVRALEAYQELRLRHEKGRRSQRVDVGRFVDNRLLEPPSSPAPSLP